MSTTLESRAVWSQIQPLLETESIPALAQRFNVRAGEIAEAIKRSGVQRKPVTALGAQPASGENQEAKPKAAKPAKAPREPKAAKPAGESAEGAPRKESKVAPFRHLLGVQTDGAIAKLAGVVAETVRMYRVRQGIPAVAQDAGKSAASASTDLPPEPEAPKKRGPGRPRKEASAAAAHAETPPKEEKEAGTPARRGIPSPIDSHVHLLGKMTDADLAEQIGVTRGAVYQYRRHRKIPAFLPKVGKAEAHPAAAPSEAPRAKSPRKAAPPPAAAPAAEAAAPVAAPAAASARRAVAPRTSWAYTVVVRRGDAESTYAVLGNDVADAASRAVAAVGEGEVLSITRYLESLT